MNELFNDLTVFELANNHQGDLKHADYIINKLAEVAHKHDINAAVKFQYRNLDTLIHPAFRNRPDVKHIPRFYSTRLSPDEFYGMVRTVKEQGLVAMCTPFDEVSVELCMDHGIEIIKVASCSATDWPLLEEVAKTKKPVIISTGGKTISDIDKIYNFCIHRKLDFALLHCIGIYPAENKDIQLNSIERMLKRYPEVPIGYSGHENPSNHLVSQMAIAKGASILERHVGHATSEIDINAYSIDVDDIEDWIEAIKTAKKICGDKWKKRIDDKEIHSLNELARGCYCRKPILKGQNIRFSDVFFAMPCQEGQISSGQFSPDIVATCDYSENDAINEKRPLSVIKDIRSIIHDIKGMLYEANVVIGKEFELELSHHFGMEHFRNHGATIISIINREYCKKIIVILPGQKNPTHYHKSKEETFQVLSGTLSLAIEDQEYEVKPGEIFTVERSVKHSFTSTFGCIFEEISTTHVRDDSFYDDPRITAMDVLARKTILKDW